MFKYEKVKFVFLLLVISTCGLAGDIRKEVVSWSREPRVNSQDKFNIRIVLYQSDKIKIVELKESWKGEKTAHWCALGYNDWQDGSPLTLTEKCLQNEKIKKTFNYIYKTKIKLAPSADIVLHDNGIVLSIQSRSSENWMRSNASGLSTLYQLVDSIAQN